MGARKRVDCLDLDDYPIFDDQIGKVISHHFATIQDWKGFFCRYAAIRRAEFFRKRLLIDCFEKAMSKSVGNGKRRA